MIVEPAAHPFLGHAEQLWNEWLEGPPTLLPAIASFFELDACPEPYLDFDAGAVPLVVLTTNPGAAMSHQSRNAILSGRSPVHPEMAYHQVARVMAEFYGQALSGSAARRISAQSDLASLGGFDGVLQVESCPWHSPTFPSKDRYLELLPSEPRLVEYAKHLNDFLVTQTTVAVSAVSSRMGLEEERLDLNPWLSWQASILGIDVDSAEVVPLVWKGKKVTSAALVSSERGPKKALLLMMGSNNFPGPKGRGRLLRAIQNSK